MKKIFVITMLLFVATTSIFAQSKKINEFILNKWKIDVLEMKKVISEKLKTEEQYQGLTGEQFDIAVETALKKIGNIKMQFDADNTYLTTTSKGVSKGKWKISKDLKTLILQSGNEPKKVFQVKEIKENKLVFFTDGVGGMTFYFELDK